jgi:hypothetical protein
MIENWKVFLWAAVHSPQFKDCYISSPIAFQVYKRHQSTWVLEICFQWRGFFPLSVPVSVLDAYLNALKESDRI